MEINNNFNTNYPKWAQFCCLCNVKLDYKDNLWETIVNLHDFYSLNLWRIFSGGLGWSGHMVSFIPGLALIGFRTTGPWSIGKLHLCDDESLWCESVVCSRTRNGWTHCYTFTWLITNSVWLMSEAQSKVYTLQK